MTYISHAALDVPPPQLPAELRPWHPLPLKYQAAQDLANECLEAVANGVTVRQWCEANEGRGAGVVSPGGVNNMTVHRWVAGDPDFAAALEEAKRMAVEALLGECIAIADDDSIPTARARLRIDTRFRFAETTDPRFARRAQVSHEHSGETRSLVVVTGVPKEGAPTIAPRAGRIAVDPDDDAGLLD